MSRQHSNEGHSTDTVMRRTLHNFKTKIGKEYSTKDVIRTWDCISKWIENNLNQNKGILLKGIGYFSIAHWDMNMRKPMFVIDEKLAKDYNLKRRRDFNSGNIQERYLNLISVAHDYQLNINMATHCFKEVVSAFRKLLFEEKDCELPFPKIGKLQVKNKTVTMKFYQEFLERQNKYFKNRTEEEKTNLQSESYNPDWNADQIKNQQRPSSTMSVISRPTSSLSQHRPGTGYDTVLPNVECDTDRPQSSLSITSQNEPATRMSAKPGSRTPVQSCDQTRPVSRTSVQSYELTRSESRTSINSNDQTRPTSRTSNNSYDQMRPTSRSSIICRPASSLSQYRPGTGYESVLPSVEDDRDRPESCFSNRSQNKPNSRSSDRPGSRTSIRSCEQIKPGSRTSVHSCEQIRPASRTSIQSCEQIKPITKLSAQSNKQNMTTSRMSVLCNKTTSSECSKPKINNTNVQLAICPTSRPNSKLPTPKLGTCENVDVTLCCSCNIRKNRSDQINLLKPDLSSLENKDFMRGDNPIDRLLSTENASKRNRLQKEIAKFNYITAQELENKIDNEKTKFRSEKNNESCIFNNRPSSNRSEKIMDLKHSLLDQIRHNNVKKENDKITSMNNEKLIQNELLKSLHDERIKNIEAKIRSKRNFYIILDEHEKKKAKIENEAKIKLNSAPTFNGIIDINDDQRQSDAKLKKHKLAEYHLKQKVARNLVNQQQKEGNINYERNLLIKFREENEQLRKNMLQKKLCRKKLLAEDLNKLLTLDENERRKKEIPGAYPMKFPLTKIGDRCRLCKKNRPGYLMEKITDGSC